jgi:hypothetical protein
MSQDCRSRACAVPSEHHGEGQLAEELSDPFNALTDFLSEEYILSQIPDGLREPFIRHLDYQLPNCSNLPFDVRCRTVMRLPREWINRMMRMAKPAQVEPVVEPVVELTLPPGPTSATASADHRASGGRLLPRLPRQRGEP